MLLKKLTPRLPSDLAKVKEKGFYYNQSKTTEYITDRCSLFLRKAGSGSLLDVEADPEGPSVTRENIVSLWKSVVDSDQKETIFLGCGKTIKDFVVAILGVDGLKFVCFDPYRMSFLLMVTKADKVTESSFSIKNNNGQGCPFVFWKGNKAVGISMPMFCELKEICHYDLTTPAISIADAIKKEDKVDASA